MNVHPPSSAAKVVDVRPEDLAGDTALTQRQKIAEASRQFEAILLRQVLAETQKTVIPSEFSDNSTAAGIYQDMITNTLSDDISKSGTLGLSKVFERQLDPPPARISKPDSKTVSQVDPRSVQQNGYRNLASIINHE